MEKMSDRPDDPSTAGGHFGPGPFQVGIFYQGHQPSVIRKEHVQPSPVRFGIRSGGCQALHRPAGLTTS